MTIEWNDEQLAAAALADRYIEIVLSTQPELLVSPRVAGPDAHMIPEFAQRLTSFRLQLINQLSQQPLPTPEDD